MSKDNSSFWIGVGSYYLLSFLLSVYPAVVLGFHLGHRFGGTNEDHIYKWGLPIFAFFIAAIYLYRHIGKWWFLLFLYIYTLPAFIQLMIWIQSYEEYDDALPNGLSLLIGGNYVIPIILPFFVVHTFFRFVSMLDGDL